LTARPVACELTVLEQARLRWLVQPTLDVWSAAPLRQNRQYAGGNDILREKNKNEQDAQLSQRDRAAGCVIVFAKSRRLELEDNILWTL